MYSLHFGIQSEIHLNSFSYQTSRRVLWWILNFLKCVFVCTFSFFRLLGTPSVYQSTLELTPTSYKDHCKRLYYLVEKQRELCGLSQNVLSVILFYKFIRQSLTKNFTTRLISNIHLTALVFITQSINLMKFIQTKI